MIPLHVDADLDVPPTDDEAMDRRTEARQTECGCRACDPGWWADEDEETETDG